MIISSQNSFKQVPSFVICTILWRAALNPLSLQAYHRVPEPIYDPLLNWELKSWGKWMGDVLYQT